MSDLEGGPAPRPDGEEPLFDAPPVSLMLIGLLLAAFGLQIWLGDVAVLHGGLSAGALREGRWWTLVSHIFLHGGVAHIAMNSAAALAFGPAVARYFGRSARGDLLFLIYFLITGVAGGLTFVALNPDSASLMVGASGAICGLWGGATRLLGRWRGLSDLWSRPVRGQLAAFALMNLIVAGLGRFGGELLGGGAQIAWQAHVGGFVAGLLLIAPFGRLARGDDNAVH